MRQIENYPNRMNAGHCQTCTNNNLIEKKRTETATHIYVQIGNGNNYPNDAVTQKKVNQI